VARLSKQERRRLAAEQTRERERARVAASPITREQLEEIYRRVATRVFHEGHDSSFSFTVEAVAGLGLDVEATRSFLHSQGCHSDWDLLVEADPCKLFGPTPTRLARMPLDHDQLHELVDWLEATLKQEPCSHDLHHTHSWLEARGVPVETMEFALIAQGGGCDCEVVMNLECGMIYPGITA